MAEENSRNNTRVVITYRKRGIFIGKLLWLIIIISSIFEAVFLSWTVVPASIFLLIILGLYIGRLINNKIFEKTGLEKKDQQALWEKYLLDNEKQKNNKEFEA